MSSMNASQQLTSYSSRASLEPACPLQAPCIWAANCRTPWEVMLTPSSTLAHRGVHTGGADETQGARRRHAATAESQLESWPSSSLASFGNAGTRRAVSSASVTDKPIKQEPLTVVCGFVTTWIGGYNLLGCIFVFIPVIPLPGRQPGASAAMPHPAGVRTMPSLLGASSKRHATVVAVLHGAS